MPLNIYTGGSNHLTIQIVFIRNEGGGVDHFNVVWCVNCILFIKGNAEMILMFMVPLVMMIVSTLTQVGF